MGSVCDRFAIATNLLKAALCQCRTFHVLDRSHFVGQLLALLALQWSQPLFGERTQRLAVVPQIDLSALEWEIGFTAI